MTTPPAVATGPLPGLGVPTAGATQAAPGVAGLDPDIAALLQSQAAAATPSFSKNSGAPPPNSLLTGLPASVPAASPTSAAPPPWRKASGEAASQPQAGVAQQPAAILAQTAAGGLIGTQASLPGVLPPPPPLLGQQPAFMP